MIGMRFSALVFVLMFAACARSSLPTVEKPALEESPSSKAPLYEEWEYIGPGPSKEWRGRHGRREFFWNGKDLYIKEKGRKEFRFFKALADSAFEGYRAAENEGCLFNYYYRPVAIAGSLVSLEMEEGILCGTNGGGWGVATFDLDKPGRLAYGDSGISVRNQPDTSIPKTKQLSLLELYSKEAILEALLENPSIKNEIEKKGAPQPKDLNELGRIFLEGDYSTFGGEVALTEFFFTDFVLDRIENGKICYRILLLATSTAGRVNRGKIEIFLPIPDKYRDALEMADRKEKGFLLKDSPEMTGADYAEFEYKF